METRAVLHDVKPLNIEAPRRMERHQHAGRGSRDTEIDNLKLLALKLNRMHVGHRSEKLDRTIEQLELRLEDLEAAAPVAAAPAPVAETEAVAKKPARRPLPASLPRTTRTHAPKHTACPECGGKLHALGEDVAEVLEYVPAHFEVIRLVRPKLSCTRSTAAVRDERRQTARRRHAGSGARAGQ